MISTSLFGDELKSMGYTLFSGVPCSYLKDLINYAINECDFVMAANEGDAVAIAGGSSIGGRKSAVLMQNSGLTNALSSLTSLIDPFQIPILGFVSLRGEPGKIDEPQHQLIGEITPDLLSLLNINWDYLSTDINKAIGQLRHANQIIEQGKPYFFIVRKGTFEPVKLQEKPSELNKTPFIKNKSKEDQQPSRYEVLQAISLLADRQTVNLAATGKTGRELYEINDAKNNLYMVGSMGCVSSLGLGLAIARQDKSIIAIDGDGALLMRMGNLATNGYYSPENLLHILLDNNSHDSTGGQQTVSHNVDFVAAAAACGYQSSIYIHHIDELQKAVEDWKQTKGLTFLYMKIASGSKKGIGRPEIRPFEVKKRLQVFLNG